MKTFRFAQLNTFNRDQKDRYDLLGEVFKNSEADLITVQEVIEPISFTGIAHSAGYESQVFCGFTNSRGDTNHVGILSKTPLEIGSFPRGSKGGFCYATTEIDGQLINVFSAHLAWGGNTEARRLQQAEHIDRIAEKLERSYPDSISILGGDLNAQPESRTIRFLTGVDLNITNDESTLWVDAWTEAGSKENWTTSSNSTNSLGRITAFHANIAYPGMVPDRRIDYIMTRGWAYGKPGYPLKFDYLIDPKKVEVSDHNGIMADMMLEV